MTNLFTQLNDPVNSTQTQKNRTCRGCGVPKLLTLDNFYANRECEDRFAWKCIACFAVDSAARNKKLTREQRDVINERNKVRLREKRRPQVEARRALLAANKGARAAEKKERVANWHKSNATRVAEIKRAWYERNKHRKLSPEDRDKMNARRRERSAEIPAIRINWSMARRMNSALKDGKGGRSWKALVPYSLEQLTVHLQRQFRKGMTWANYGSRWHIDHITPLSSFDIQSLDSDEFRAAWALTNLQPLWARDNKSKNDRRIYLL